LKRCAWAATEQSIAYHDEEWGVPVHDDRVFFEFLILEGAQAGLSWETILKKRQNYRAAFFEFDPARVARMRAARIEKLLATEDAGASIVRNRAKVESAVINAKAFLTVAKEHGSFAEYIWRFVDPSGGRAPIVGSWRLMAEVPVTTAESDAMSKDLKKRGFKFVGSTICYAFMQATGLVNDHLVGCVRRAEVDSRSP
jgi:DNA-3-methyladenine glycosylase I